MNVRLGSFVTDALIVADVKAGHNEKNRQIPVCRYVPAWANAQVPKTVDMFLSGIGRTGMRYVPVISFPRAMSRR